MPITVDDIEKALRQLDGQAHLDQIETEVSKISLPPLPKSLSASIRGLLNDHCPTASRPRGKPLFENVYGQKARKGWWALIESRQATVTALDSENEDGADSFTPNTNDVRQKALRAIRIRRGQKKFRDALLAAYENRCVITGCDVKDVLEAAHITPYLGPDTNHVTNGLLLRADLHTLFDTNLLAVNPNTNEVLVAPSVKDPVYRALQGEPLRAPKAGASSPSVAALRQHRSDCDW